MENLIKQTADYYKTSEHIVNEQKANKRALKEIIFSGMSRCGFFKKFVYLKDLDHITKDNYYVCFIDLPSEEPADAGSFFSGISEEAEAWGVPVEIRKTETGFMIELPEEYGLKRFGAVIANAEIKTDVVNISYIQTPFPYELRYIESLPDDQSSKIREFYDNAMKELSKEQTAKKLKKQEPKAEKPQKEKPDDGWVQASFFDLFDQSK